MENLVVNFDSIEKNIKEIKLLLPKMYDETITKQEYQHLQYLLIYNYMIQDILLHYRFINKADEFFYDYPVCNMTLNGDKLLFISDTHIGHESENISLVQEVYNFALKNGINTVIHAGDLIEGTSRNYIEMNKLPIEERFDVLNNEINRAISFLPKEIVIKLLLGNHDYSALRSCPPLINSFFYHDNLNILGMGKVSINWNNLATMQIIHQIKNISFKSISDENILKFQGHSHKYYVDCDSNTIKLPSLSNDFKERKINLSTVGYHFVKLKDQDEPVFLTTEMVDYNTILIKEFLKQGKGNIHLNEELIYDLNTKKLQFLKKKY